MRVRVVIPTTGGPLAVRGLRPRAGLPNSAAFADGDYRPLAWSADYARLSAPEGPLRRLMAADRLVPHELRLDRSFDTGRSWEAPVALAHALLARGHAVAGPDEAADMVLWATGALDLDLALIEGDYALLDKAEASRDLLARHPTEGFVALLPPAHDREAAEATLLRLRGDGAITIARADTIGEALAVLERPSNAPKPEREPESGPPKPRHQGAWLAGGAALLLCVGLVVALLALGPGFGGGLSDRGALSATDGHAAPLPSEAEAQSATPRAVVDASTATTARPLLALEELHAPAGSSCRRVVFGADAADRRPVALVKGGAFGPSRLTADLCGLAFRPLDGRKVEIGAGLAAASLPPSTQPDGSVSVFLRSDVGRKLVYAVQVLARDGGQAQTYTQELEP